MHVNNNHFSDKFNNGWKNIRNGRHFSHFMSIIWPCGHNNDFKFNNGGGLLSSVLLFNFTSLIWPCGRNNLKSFSCILFKLLCVLLMSSSRTNSITGLLFLFFFGFEKKWKRPIYWDFSHFTSIIWPCGRDNLKSFSCILFKFVMLMLLMPSSQKSSIMAEKKKIKMADLLRFFAFYVNNLTLWSQLLQVQYM